MGKWKLGFALGFMTWWSIGLVVAANAQQTDIRVDITTTDGTGKPAKLASQPLTAGANVTVVAKPGHQLQTFSTSGRYLVRLKDQPLQPFIRKFKSQATAAGTSQSAMQARLVSISAQQKQRIQSAQNQLITTGRSRKLITQVHHQFRELTNSLSVTLAADAVAAVRQLPQVEAVYPDNEVHVSLTESVPTTHAPQVWAMKDAQGNPITGKGIKVAILDTGIDYTQPDLGGCVGPGCKVVAGQSFLTDTSATDFMDRHGHGTHVAGIVAASGTLKGVAPDASLYAYKVLNDQGSGYDSNIIAALEMAVNPDGDTSTQDGADIINMSLGGYGLPDSPLSEAANAAVGAGTLVVVAAGNSGSNYGTIGSPGNAERVLTVGAINNQDEMADFSSRGPVAGVTYVKPEIVAPGVNINSVKAGGGYTVMSGTSMATPHVAGGAALVLQAHPGLSADDLKSLLVSSARDLGQDVFSQGAGAMDLLAAVQAKVLVTSPLQYLGFVDNNQPLWNVPAKISVKNFADTDVPLSLAPPAVPLTGMSINLPANYQKILAPGAQTDIDYAVVVDNQLLPYSERASFHHENTFSLNAGGAALRIPVALIKAAQLTVDTGTNVNYLMLISADNSTSEMKSLMCSSTTTSTLFNIRPGKYDLVVNYCGSNNALVFKEKLDITDSLQLKVAEADATIKIGVAKVVGGDGLEVDSNRLRSKLTPLSWYHEPSKVAVYTFGSDTTGVLFTTNEVSAAFKLRGALLVQDTGANSPVPETFYHNFALDEGINTEQLVTLDAADMSKLDFLYDDKLVIDKGIASSFYISETRSLGQWYAMGFQVTNATAQFTPVRSRLYATPNSFKDGEWYPMLDVGRIEMGNYGFNEYNTALRSGFLGFPDKGNYKKSNGYFTAWQDSSFFSSTGLLEVEDSGYFNNTYLSYNPSYNSISVLDPAMMHTYMSLMRDLTSNELTEDSHYTLSCDGVQVAEGKTKASEFFASMSGHSCDQSLYEIIFPTRFLGVEHSSRVRITLNTKANDQMLAVSSPMLEQLLTLDDGNPARILKGAAPSLSLKARDTVTNQYYKAEAVRLEYRLGDGEWHPLMSEDADNNIVARLPLIAGQQLGSLRITINNSQGSGVEHQLDSFFLLGTGAERPVSVPEFGKLPALSLEATGPLTAYELVPATAFDRRDGTLTATTETHGPYAVGSYEILWTVTNSAGVSATARQTLVIKDTTAPMVLPPADISTTATGEVTPVNLGFAQAFDIVDGVFNGFPDQAGPFTVGSHRITWLAVDKAGNVGSATQWVTINEMPSSSSSVSSSSSSSSSSSLSSSSSAAQSSTNVQVGGGGGSGGGGGAVSIFMLLLLSFLSFGLRERGLRSAEPALQL